MYAPFISNTAIYKKSFLTPAFENTSCQNLWHFTNKEQEDRVGSARKIFLKHISELNKFHRHTDLTWLSLMSTICINPCTVGDGDTTTFEAQASIPLRIHLYTKIIYQMRGSTVRKHPTTSLIGRWKCFTDDGGIQKWLCRLLIHTTMTFKTNFLWCILIFYLLAKVIVCYNI